jgi:hypothetical protein
MSVPLATLRRHGTLVWLLDPLGMPAPAAMGKGGADAVYDLRHGRRRPMAVDDDAHDYLRFWKGDVGAVMALRGALQRIDPSAPVFGWSDDEVLRKLAGRLARGAAVVVESLQPPAPAVLPAVAAAPAVVEPPAIPVAQLLAPAKPPVPPLLPLLEEVQIEGAEVLPEIMQSLEQVDITIGEINLQPVSLEPTPSKVPAIESAMKDASTTVTKTLDEL